MGLGALNLADMEGYIRIVTSMLNGETAEVEIERKNRKIRFLNPGAWIINTDDPVELHVSAYGLCGRALTAKLWGGWIFFFNDVNEGILGLEGMQKKLAG